MYNKIPNRIFYLVIIKIHLCPTHKFFLNFIRRIKTNKNTEVYANVVPIPRMIDG